MIVQIMILITGPIGIWLSQDHRSSFRKYACIVGLIGQPFWFIATSQDDQWGMFIVCFFYTYSWLKGFYNNWIKKG